MTPDPALPRHDWTRAEVEALFDLPFPDLLYRAASVHRRWFRPGGDPAVAAAVGQDRRLRRGLRLLEPVGTRGHRAGRHAADGRSPRDGAGGFGPGGRRAALLHGGGLAELKDRDLTRVAAMVAGVKALGLETCATLGMLTAAQARALRAAGLDDYNHNLDTAPEDYARVVGTRTWQDRLETLAHVRDAGIAVCCGGIVGMGETRAARAGLLHALATLPAHPESLPVNALVPIPGTRLADSPKLDGLEFVRTVAAARLVCPRAVVRLSAGRDGMSRELQALCFLAGANSIFIGASC